MNAAPCALPDAAALTAGLASVLRFPVTVRSRRPNTYASIFPSEIVVCGLENGHELQLLCKYAAGAGHPAHGHRAGVAYEAEVYRHVLHPLPLPAPAFYGTFFGPGEETCLILEYMDGAVLADEASPVADGMAVAARWAGRFHAATEHWASGVLNRYNGEYYAQWARRTWALASPWHDRLPWLAALCRRAEGFLPSLVDEPWTVIHGEFTPHNVLIRGQEAYPVDWESAAIALGEIDLACLTDKWPGEIVRRCEMEYQKARWPGGAPRDFEHRLALGRLYWDFRWLGDRPEWTSSEKVGPRFEHLRLTAARLGLLDSML